MKRLFSAFGLALVVGACGSGVSTGTGSSDGGFPVPDPAENDGGPGPGPTNDGGPNPGEEDSGPNVGEIPIPTLRDPSAPGHPAFGATVTVSGVVTGAKTTGNTHGFFLQDTKAKSWAGIYIYVNTSTVPVARGDLVTAKGVYKDYRGFEEVDAFLAGNNIVRTGTGTVPPALVVTVADIGVGGPRVKELQSMLLRLTNVEATTTTNQIDFSVRQFGTAGPEIFVTSYMANDIGPSPFPITAGTRLSSITGVGYHVGATDQSAIPKLAPLSAADVQQ